MDLPRTANPGRSLNLNEITRCPDARCACMRDGSMQALNISMLSVMYLAARPQLARQTWVMASPTASWSRPLCGSRAAPKSGGRYVSIGWYVSNSGNQSCLEISAAAESGVRPASDIAAVAGVGWITGFCCKHVG